jgi:iron complex outermembrane receptor protein
MGKLKTAVVIGLLAAAGQAAGQTSPSSPSSQTTAETSAKEYIRVKARRLLQKEKNSPSAVTELGEKQVEQEGLMGSTTTLLRQAPSVYVYQGSIGENSPVFSIRGTRGLEVAETLDDIPMQDLLSGGRAANLGNAFTLSQIDGVTIYPGVAYPDKNTFGTIGGTISYTSKRSSNDFSIDLTGSIGSFQTYQTGIEINSGRLDNLLNGVLGTGDNAPKVLLQYSNTQTAGYVDYTPAHYNNFEFAFDKPYDDGLSLFQATLLYNTGEGDLNTGPTASPLYDLYGRYANYTPEQLFVRESDQYFTFYIKDNTYVNDYVTAGVNLFYRNSDTVQINYENPDIALNGFPPGTAAFVNAPYTFFDPAQFGIGPGYFWLPGYFNYNPAIFVNNPKTCPADAAAQAPYSPCGLNAQSFYAHDDTYGIQPHVTLLLPLNTVKLGALIAKESQPTPQSYIWGTPNIPVDPGYNQFQPNGYNGGSTRTIYQAYGQDKIDLLDDTLHITPGVTLEATYSSNEANDFAYENAAGNIAYIPYYKLHKYDRDVLPFFNTSYDFDKIAPALAGLSVYGSFGTSALFAPTTDFGPTVSGGVPYASIVHMYEGGIKYDTSRLLLAADYFYQKVDRDFGFYAGEGTETGENFYDNSGEREFKGIETTVTWQATPEWQFFANGSYLLAKYLKDQLTFTTIGEDQYGIAIKDAPISGVPSFLANFGVEYDHKSLLRDSDALSIRLSGQFTGPQYTTYDLSSNQPFPPFSPDETAGATVTNLHDQLNAFTVYNLLITYTLPTPELYLKHVQFQLNLQNLTNERYWQYFYSQIPPVNGEYLGGAYNNGLPGEPFSATFSVSARF